GFRGEPLDREGEDLLRFLVRVAARLLLQVAPQGGRLVAGLVFEVPQQLLLGLLRGEPGDLLEPGTHRELLRDDGLLPLVQRAPPLLEPAGPILEPRQPLLHELLAPLALPAPARGLLLERLARLHQLLARRQHHPLTRVGQEPLALGRRGPRRGFRRAPLDPAPQQIERHAGGDASAEEACDDPQHVRHMIYLRHRSAWQAERDSSTAAPRPPCASPGARASPGRPRAPPAGRRPRARPSCPGTARS